MKALTWLLRILDSLIDRILDRRHSGSHGPTRPSARRTLSRDPQSGRWIEADTEPTYDDNGRQAPDEDGPDAQQ